MMPPLRTRQASTFALSLCGGVLACCVSTGCRSFSSTPISRSDGDCLAGDSNGQTRWKSSARPHKGLPVKLKVTTHWDVYIKERYCVELSEKEKEGKVTHQLDEPLSATPLYFVETKPVQTDQVVLVDFKRPGSGSLNMDATFTDEQYFKKITSKLQDDTITDSAALVKAIAKFTAVPVGADEPKDSERRKWLERTVAYQRFDINDPLYEQKLDEFVSHHLNACNSCSSSSSDAR